MFQPGSTIGRYLIVALIDAGGMADVYRVRDPEGGPDLALKVLPPELARDETRARRFYQEIRAAETLRHPNIVALRDVVAADGLYFYTMDLMEGGSLKSRINEGMQPDEALQVMVDISAALSHAHDKGFIHRDIKPGNILFRGDGTALLSDFGIVKVVGRRTVDTRTGMSIGSPHYMSPEQASGKKITPASDLYSLGIVFYEMLTGRVPFDAEESIAVALMHLKEPPRPLPGNLRRFQPVMNKLLAKNGNKRFADAEALQRAIIQLRTRRQQPLAATQLIDRVQRPCCKRTLWAAGGGLLAILVMSAFFAVMNGGTPPLPPAPDKKNVVIVPRKSIQDQTAVPQLGKSAPPPDDPDSRAVPQPTTAGPVQPPSPVPAAITEKIFAPLSPVAAAPTPPTEPHSTRPEPRTVNHEPKARDPEKQTAYPASLPSQLKGAVQVVTTPAGAMVWLDGQQQPGLTPITLSGVGVGKHQLRVRKDKYRDVEDTIEIKHGMKLLDEIVLQGREFTRLVEAPLSAERGTGTMEEVQPEAPDELRPGAYPEAEASHPPTEKRPPGEAEPSGAESQSQQQQKIPIVW